MYVDLHIVMKKHNMMNALADQALNIDAIILAKAERMFSVGPTAVSFFERRVSANRKTSLRSYKLCSHRPVFGSCVRE